jgi:hypothetical protein
MNGIQGKKVNGATRRHGDETTLAVRGGNEIKEYKYYAFKI